MKVGDRIRQTQTRFRNMDDFEAYINAIDEGYDAEDAIVKGYIHELDTPQLIKLTDLKIVMDVILNMKLLNIEETIALYRVKVIVSLNALIS